jgi:hypothetical protein
MIDTDCLHPEAELVVIVAESTFVSWCSICGSLRDNRGGHGIPAGTWRAPAGVVLPGWTCACGGFNGCLKEWLSECRGCGLPRGTQPLTGGGVLG